MPQPIELTTYDDVMRSFSWNRLWALFDGDCDRMNLAHECLDRHPDQGPAISVKFVDGHREHHEYATLTELSGRFANWGSRSKRTINVDPWVNSQNCGGKRGSLLTHIVGKNPWFSPRLALNIACQVVFFHAPCD